ncbi:unnamed protein product [Rhizophagus irregularis]|nr:unnamed protein product [Rhizophagus irregularis]
MATIRDDLIFAAIQKAFALNNYNKNLDEQYKFMQRTILKDKSLTKNEKLEAIKKLNKNHDIDKIRYNEGRKRICKNCKMEHLATLYCEFCISNYLKSKFSNWTSGNNVIDDLIQKCQMESLVPNKVVEWIPYNNLQNIKYLTEGGFSKIYTADWIDGQYFEWDSTNQRLKRRGTVNVILKKLENVLSANINWFNEAKSHLIINNKWSEIVPCYGLTQDPSNGNYMLVMRKLDANLREYLYQNQGKLTWKEKIKITADIIDALNRIHKENHIGKEYTKASDMYSIAMIMWEISSGQPPFANYENDYDLAMDIVNGKRPKIIPGTPLIYKELMEKCWDANPTNRYDINTLLCKFDDINKLFYQSKPNNDKNIFSKFLKKFRKSNKPNSTEIKSYYTYTSSKLFTSKIYQFDNLSETEAFHSKPYSFNIPENIDDFNNKKS